MDEVFETGTLHREMKDVMVLTSGLRAVVERLNLARP